MGSWETHVNLKEVTASCCVNLQHATYILKLETREEINPRHTKLEYMMQLLKTF